MVTGIHCLLSPFAISKTTGGALVADDMGCGVTDRTWVPHCTAPNILAKIGFSWSENIQPIGGVKFMFKIRAPVSWCNMIYQTVGSAMQNLRIRSFVCKDHLLRCCQQRALSVHVSRRVSNDVSRSFSVRSDRRGFWKGVKNTFPLPDNCFSSVSIRLLGFFPCDHRVVQ